MALFFDAAWFDAALLRVHLGRADLARALGLSERELAELWKDQREVSAREVATIAALLCVPAAEVADRAGISTPVPRPAADPAALAAALAELGTRMDRLERVLAEIKALVLDLRREP